MAVVLLLVYSTFLGGTSGRIMPQASRLTLPVRRLRHRSDLFDELPTAECVPANPQRVRPTGSSPSSMQWAAQLLYSTYLGGSVMATLGVLSPSIRSATPMSPVSTQSTDFPLVAALQGALSEGARWTRSSPSWIRTAFLPSRHSLRRDRTTTRASVSLWTHLGTPI